MKVAYNGEQVQLSIEASKELLDRLAKAEPELRARSFDPGAGFRPNSLGGGSPSTVLDELGDPMPPLSDPVGELVVNGGLDDPVRAAHRHVVETIDTCRRRYREALDLQVQTIAACERMLAEAVNDYERTRLSEDSKAASNADDMWCTSCIRVEYCSPRLATDRLATFAKKHGQARADFVAGRGWCWDCARWWVAEGVEPPVEFVEKVVASGSTSRMTARLRLELLSLVPSAPKRRKSKRKAKR